MASAFKQVATGGRREINAAEVRSALAALVDSGHGVFLQTLPTARWVCLPGSDLDALVREVKELSYGKGTYFALNPCPVGEKITNLNVIRRRRMLFDFDPIRPKDSNSSDSEHETAREVACRAMDYLCEHGWPLPIGIDSGNGWHLVYAIDLPNDSFGRTLVSGALKHVARLFDTDSVKLGVECCDARRISKLPGTPTRKGPNLPDRPQRWAKMIVCPDPVEVVPVEAMTALVTAGVTAGGVNGHAAAPLARSPFLGRAMDSKGLRAYGLKALKEEAARIRMAPVNDRNNTVNDAAFRLGTLVQPGCLSKGEVEAEVELAASANGVLADEPTKTRDTFRRAIAAGVASPRNLPRTTPVGSTPVGSTPGAAATTAAGADAGKAPPDPIGQPLTVCAASVTPLQVSWLWPNRVPKRFVTVFAGRTSIGKSFVTCDLIARLSNGGEVPFGNGECFQQGGTLFISEDPHDYMLTPRLIELGANLNLVQFMTWNAMASYSLADTDMLGQAFLEVTTPKLVVIDPPTNFLGDADEHRNAEVRQILMRLVGWIQSVDAACVLIMHINKQTGKGIEALNRVLGSVAWITTSRIAHSFSPDPDDPERVLFLPMKNNLGPLGNGLAYRIAKTETLAKVEWIGEVDITADEALNREVKKKKRSVVASEWLEEMFAAVDQLPSKVVFVTKDKDTTISDDALREAKEVMGIMAEQRCDPDGKRAWWWFWPKTNRQNWMSKKTEEAPADERVF